MDLFVSDIITALMLNGFNPYMAVIPIVYVVVTLFWLPFLYIGPSDSNVQFTLYLFVQILSIGYAGFAIEESHLSITTCYEVTGKDHKISRIAPIGKRFFSGVYLINGETSTSFRPMRFNGFDFKVNITRVACSNEELLVMTSEFNNSYDSLRLRARKRR
jgi:hypothetical protein